METPTFGPGIVGLFNKFPNAAYPLNLLAETLLRGESPLPQWFREYIASRVSANNDTHFCNGSHGETALLLSGETTISALHNRVKSDPKLTALLTLAISVAMNLRSVILRAQVASCLSEGATEQEIHDVVLISAAFCMYNRYVRTLNDDHLSVEQYKAIGHQLVNHGYLHEQLAEEGG